MKALNPNDPLIKRALSAIPTEYGGILFRSRLEAKWAAMFDLLEWEWEYEPLDLAGYIPDFVLKFYRPILVEVKPWTPGDDAKPLQSALDAQEWDGEIWIAGAQLGNFGPDTACGLLRDSEGGWDHAVMSRCVHCSNVTLRTDNLSWRCRVCGKGDGNGSLSPFPVAEANSRWRAAHEETQWRPR